MSALLEVNNISKRFGGLQAVDRLSLTVNEGEILGLIGQTAPANRPCST